MSITFSIRTNALLFQMQGPSHDSRPLGSVPDLSVAMGALKEQSQRDALEALATALLRQEPDEEAASLFDDPFALIRYLQAKQWQLDHAEEMIRKTARWRKEYGLARIRSGEDKELLTRENRFNKMYVRGYDKMGRPVIYIRSRNETSTDSELSIRHSVYSWERACACVDRRAAQGRLVTDVNDPTARKFVIIMDFDGMGFNNLQSPSTSQLFCSILEEHYPQRLHHAYMLDVPWVLSAVIRTASQLFSEETAEKFQIVCEEGAARTERMKQDFDLLQLETCAGGSATIPFHSGVYMNVMKDGTEFGLEFDEQLQLADSSPFTFGSFGEVSALGTPKSCGSLMSPGSPWGSHGLLMSEADFWSINSDLRVLALSKEERAAVRSLATLLATEEPEEEHDGLLNDAGSLIRYLRARKWNIEEAKKALLATAAWRKEFDWAGMLSGKYDEMIARECAHKRLYVRGYDRAGRPMVYVRLCQPYSGNHEEALRYLVYCVERALAAQKSQQAPWPPKHSDDGKVIDTEGKLTVVFDFWGYRARHRPPAWLLKQWAQTLQDHYPERLGEAYLFNAPAKIWATWSLVRKFLAPETCEKIVLVWDREHLVKLLHTVFDKSSLELCMGGRNSIPFDPDIFLSQRVKGSVFGSEFDSQREAVLEAASNRPRVVRFKDPSIEDLQSFCQSPGSSRHSDDEEWSPHASLLLRLIGSGWLW